MIDKIKYYIWGMCILMLGGLAACTTTSQPTDVPQTVAVWDLENLTPNTQQPDMGEILSSTVIQTLQTKPDITVIERQRLLLALEELNIGTTKLVDQSTRLKIGKMLGAQRMIFGGYQVFGNMMRMDLRMVDVQTGAVIKAVEKTTPSTNVSQWLDAARQAANEMF